MATFNSDFLYALDENGNSTNGKVVSQIANSAASSIELPTTGSSRLARHSPSLSAIRSRVRPMTAAIPMSAMRPSFRAPSDRTVTATTFCLPTMAVFPMART